jgi:DNA-binding MarR family transcriptional regulator
MANEAEETRYADMVMPALLGQGRRTYGEAMRRALAVAGCDDVPPNGMFVIGGLAMGAGNAPLGQLGRQMGISKQAAGQLVDTLVLRGYVTRETDAGDRRRFSVALTERGRYAAAIQREAREKIDAALAARIGADTVAAARRALGALVEIGGEQGEEPH